MELPFAFRCAPVPPPLVCHSHLGVVAQSEDTTFRALCDLPWQHAHSSITAMLRDEVRCVEALGRLSPIPVGTVAAICKAWTSSDEERCLRADQFLLP